MSLSNLGALVDIELRQGTTFSVPVALKNDDGTPVDLTGADVRAQMRRTARDSTAVPFTVTFIDRAAGEFEFGLSAEVTALLTPPTYQWDMELVDAASRVMCLFHGVVRIVPEVTR